MRSHSPSLVQQKVGGAWFTISHIFFVNLKLSTSRPTSPTVAPEPAVPTLAPFSTGADRMAPVPATQTLAGGLQQTPGEDFLFCLVGNKLKANDPRAPPQCGSKGAIQPCTHLTSCRWQRCASMRALIGARLPGTARSPPHY